MLFALDIAQFTDKPKLRNYYTNKICTQNPNITLTLNPID